MTVLKRIHVNIEIEYVFNQLDVEFFKEEKPHRLEDESDEAIAESIAIEQRLQTALLNNPEFLRQFLRGMVAADFSEYLPEANQFAEMLDDTDPFDVLRAHVNLLDEADKTFLEECDDEGVFVENSGLVLDAVEFKLQAITIAEITPDGDKTIEAIK